MRAAGYPNGFARSGAGHECGDGRVAQAIQAQLAAVGIQVEIVSRDASSMREAVRKGDTDMAITDWWADYPDADNFLYPLFHSTSFGPGGNYAFYSDRVTDSLIIAARRTVDQTARVALYRRIDNRVFEAAPWLYLVRRPWRSIPRSMDIPVVFNGQRWTKVHVKAGRQPSAGDDSALPALLRFLLLNVVPGACREMVVNGLTPPRSRLRAGTSR
jgi:peptide/nickel transport system substrate-binding protein/oligopeptide transport system substrate-binding protein